MYYIVIGIITERKYIAYLYTSVYISNIRFISAIRRYGRYRIPIIYADKRVRRGYLILARIIADYKE